MNPDDFLEEQYEDRTYIEDEEYTGEDDEETWEEFLESLEDYTGRPSGFFSSLPEDVQKSIRDAWGDGRCDLVEIGNSIDDYYDEEYRDDAMQADAETLASAGWGTDEDYGFFG